jgi:hypothetical protein
MVGGKLFVLWLLFVEEEFIRLVLCKTWWDSCTFCVFGGRPGPRFFVVDNDESCWLTLVVILWDNFDVFMDDDEPGKLWRVWPAECFNIDAGVPLAQSNDIVKPCSIVCSMLLTSVCWTLTKVAVKVTSAVTIHHADQASMLMLTEMQLMTYGQRCPSHYFRWQRTVDRTMIDPDRVVMLGPTFRHVQ